MGFKCAICGSNIGYGGKNYNGERVCNVCFEHVIAFEQNPDSPMGNAAYTKFEKCISEGKVNPSIQTNILRLIQPRMLHEKFVAENEGKDINPTALTDFLTTTTFSFEGYQITKYYDVMTSEVVLGTGLISEKSAAISDFFGTTDSAFEAKLSSAKEAAFVKLKKKALYVGASGLVGIQFSMMTIGTNMIVTSVSGTPVDVKK